MVDIYKRSLNLINNEGLSIFIRKCLNKLLRFLIYTNNALWFKRDLNKPILDIRSNISIKVDFSSKERIIKWIKEKSSQFPWIYIEKEFEVGYKEKHLYPFISYNDIIIGYIKIAFNKAYIQDFNNIIHIPFKDAFIYDTFVLPEYRRQNVASILLRESLIYLNNSGYERAWCHIPKWNTASISLYHNAGFEEAAFIKYVRILRFSFFNLHPESMMIRN